MKSALAHGTTAAEVMEVLELVSVLGIHSCTEGVPLLMQKSRVPAVRTVPVERPGPRGGKNTDTTVTQITKQNRRNAMSTQFKTGIALPAC